MRVAPMTSRFLDACRRRPTDVRPVWFMRQAGRYMKQYRQISGERHGILEICKRPDLAAAVTLQPVEDAGRGRRHHFRRPAAAGRADGAEAALRRGRRPDHRQPGPHFRRRRFAFHHQYGRSRLRRRGHPAGGARARRQGAGDRLRRRAVHHGELHDRGRRLAQFHSHQEDDVQRRDAVAPADGQDRRRAGAVRAPAGHGRRARHPGVRQLGGRSRVRTTTCATPRRIPAR